jgi:hypothetical protein
MWSDQFLELLKQSSIGQSTLEKAISFKQQHLPKRIYKYRSDNQYARENLKSNTIWLASPASYNDPYDCFLRFAAPNMVSAFERGLIDPFVAGYKLNIPPEKIEEAKQSATPLHTLTQIIASIGTTDRNPQQAAEVISKAIPAYVQSSVEVIQFLRNIAKLCSFSAVNDSILMWSHYADNHKGFCVEYDLEQFDSSDAFLKNLYPVIYSHELVDLTPWGETLITGKRDDFNTIFPLLGVLQKFEGWQYEQEWRYISFQEKPTNDRNRQMPRPSRVFLGAKTEASAAEELLAICEANKVPVSQMRMADDKYELLANPTPDH